MRSFIVQFLLRWVASHHLFHVAIRSFWNKLLYWTTSWSLRWIAICTIPRTRTSSSTSNVNQAGILLSWAYCALLLLEPQSHVWWHLVAVGFSPFCSGRYKLRKVLSFDGLWRLWSTSIHSQMLHGTAENRMRCFSSKIHYRKPRPAAP